MSSDTEEDPTDRETTPTLLERPEDVLEALKLQLARTQEQLIEKSREVTSLTREVQITREQLDYTTAEATREREQTVTLRTEMDTREMQSELSRLRAVEQLRQEHQLAMSREAELRYSEQQRFDLLLQGLRHSHQIEKEQLQQQIAILESSRTADSVPHSLGGSRDSSLVTSSDYTLSVSTVSTGPVTPVTSTVSTAPVTPVTSTVSTAPVIPVTSTVSTTPLTLVMPTVSSMSLAPVTSTTGRVASPTTSVSATTSTHESTGMSAAATGLSRTSRVSFLLPPDGTTTTTTIDRPLPTVSLSRTVTPTSTPFSVLSPMARDFVPTSHVSGYALPSLPVTAVPDPPPPPLPVSTMYVPVTSATAVPRDATTREPTVVMQVLNKLVQAQTDVMAAQARAVAVQNLPGIGYFTGEGGDTADRFDRWIERFHERAKFAGWSREEQLYQLKLHLDKSALEVFRMLPKVECDTLEHAVTALKKRFKPADIEELRGLEFYHRAQGGSETVEQLGLSIQRLGRKAFPSMTGKEFDRLLKGRFYQALLVKWQRKLGCPKPDEGFHDLLARARMMEEHEKQFAASALNRHETKRNADGEKRSNPHPKQKDKGNHAEKPPSPSDPSSLNSERRCYKCKQTGHLRRDCPSKPEAPGRKAGVSMVTSPESQGPTFTEAELEKLLAEKRLAREKDALSHSQNSVVTAVGERADAVGSLVYVEVYVEGVPISAMLDTGAQSTIISRSTLHAVNKSLLQQGQRLPELELPTVRLYGKVGPKGGKELTITAQISLTFTSGNKSVSVPVFVQPDSEQVCLLGVNVISALGFKVLNNDGSLILPRDAGNSDTPTPVISTVSLVRSVPIPCQKVSVVQAKITDPVNDYSDMLFEPDCAVLSQLGVSMLESVVKVDANGHVYLPVDNYQCITAHLEAGLPLGTVRPTVVSSLGDQELADNPNASTNAHVKAIQRTPERTELLVSQLALPSDQLLPDEHSELGALINEFQDVFALTDSELGCTDVLRHFINTGDHPPIKQQPYRTPVIRREKVSQLIDDMEAQGVVQSSVSPWASPVMLVPKKDGHLRF